MQRVMLLCVELLLTMRVANSGPHVGKRDETVLARPMATPACSW